MARPDLYDLATKHGGLELIPDELCGRYRIGAHKVWAVLVHRLLNADPVGAIWWGTPTIAAHLGMYRTDVRTADQVLLAAGLMEAAGKRKGANSYRMIPALLNALDAPEPDLDAPADPEPEPERGGEHGGEPRHEEKGSEVKSRGEVPNGPQRLRDIGFDLTVEDDKPNPETHGFLDDLSRLTSLDIDHNQVALAAARNAVDGGYTAAHALDVIAAGNDLTKVGAGFILTKVRQLRPDPKRWRRDLPRHCPHEHPAHVLDAYPEGVQPHECRRCRAEAGDPMSVVRLASA